MRGRGPAQAPLISISGAPPDVTPGTRYELVVRRGGRTHELVITVPPGSRPAEGSS
ncbi:MAG TPA: hypothetical protein VFR81_02425 [Longimicrobium sp.]|nr:hypothetical protein [Longimicrobium sp.]